ncbi:serine/threonine protein kinase [Magnaporthiopsis poae ATCC 64411]|uniref:Serine/threonine protein kinase n=1 Tax=Magnaporthiopsis poae (strain ATCC 64411 / 73-15) TaxID=644358 RepID=A0A0C4DQ76_MAGP6|nr:serine/threonine protein kinase [Magnaporthiopsis poae ATCC 64411]
MRMQPTMLGASGRVYAKGDVLHRCEYTSNIVVVKAESGGRSFVLKRPFPHTYNRSLDFAAELAGSRRLRLHVDRDLDGEILVYPFFRTTLFDLIKEDPEFPVFERSKIITTVAEAIQEMHKNSWAHLDINPNNVLVDWTCNGHGDKTVTNTVVGGLSNTVKLEAGDLLDDSIPGMLGTPEWRSPEVAAANGMSMASDIYSFGLLMLYVLGAGDMLRKASPEGLVLNGGEMTLGYEDELLIRHLVYFGPATEGLLKVLREEERCLAVKQMSDYSQREAELRPSLRFQSWGQGLGPEVHALISGMVKMDPAARLTIDQVLPSLRSFGGRSID